MGSRKGAMVVAGIVAGLIVGGFAGPARGQGADEPSLACASSFEETQVQRKEGKLLRAREEAIRCAAPACPSVISSSCVKWSSELEAETPSVVVVGREADGSDIAGARVLVDGARVRDRVDGRPIPLDPGPHEIALERAGDRPGRSPLVRIVLAIGEQRRRVEVSFGGAGPTRTGTSAFPWTPAIVSWSVGAAFVVAGAVAGGVALAFRSTLEDACPSADACPADREGDIASLHRSEHVSTATFVIGGVGIATAVVFTILAATSPATPARAILLPKADAGGLGFSF